MKQNLLLILMLAFLAPLRLSAQLPDGSTAPDWTLSDIYGNSYHLYDLLDQGKMVALDFSATWCGPCWNYMQGGQLEIFWEEHGPNGLDDAQVFFIEGDPSTGMADLLGETSQSQGNWVAAIPYPIIDLPPGDPTANQYQINYFPTLYAVCSDYKIYELGQVPASEWAEFITSCGLSADVASVEPAVCYGEGGVSLDVTGGVSPIDYDWSNGSHQPSLQNVGAGTYSVTVTEANGKDYIIEDIVITGEEFPIELASSQVEDALCFEDATGAVSIELENGNAPFDYDWSNGAQTQNISNVSADTYTVVATDANGCTFEESFTVEQPEELVATYETTPDYCDQGNGTIALEIDGGVGNYEIFSSEGNVEGDLIVDLYAGNVTATIEDGNGCVWEESVEIEFEAAPELYFSPDPNISCTQPTTLVSGYVQGGSGDYEYEWTTTNGNIVGPSNQSTVTVDQEGDYVLLVTDIFSGCPVENEVEVTSTVEAPAVTAGDDAPMTCEQLQLALQGNGDPANTVNWTTPDGHILSGGNTYLPTVDAPGLYIISVTNPANSCSNVDSVIINNDINPAVANYQYQTSSLTMIGTDISTGSNLSGWLWNFGDGNTSTEPNAVHTFAAEGTYDVCLSVQNGCGSSNTCYQVQVVQSGSTISVLAEVQNVLCNADSTGSVTVQVNGGTGNYTYLWTGPGGQTYTDPNIADLPAGLYQLVVSDEQANLFIGEYTITEPAAIILVGSTIVDNLCFGQSNGLVAVDLSGGVGPFSYSFNGGAYQSENTYSNIPAGVVECLVSDANGCPFVAGPYTIQQPPVVEHLAGISGVRCFGESNGAATLTVNGGVAPYSYLWDIGAQTTPEINQLPAGQYTCVISDNNGCLSQAVVQVTQPEVLTVANTQIVNASGTEQNNGSITIDVAGGTAPYGIAWNNGGTGTSIQGLVPGEYWYTITDANGCIWSNASAPVVITGTVSTTTPEWSEFISITPNPSKGNVMVSWKGLVNGNGTMTLVNLAGQRLLTKAITSGTGNWDLSGASLTSGVYIVLFEMNGEAAPFKLVVL